MMKQHISTLNSHDRYAAASLIKHYGHKGDPPPTDFYMGFILIYCKATLNKLKTYIYFLLALEILILVLSTVSY